MPLLPVEYSYSRVPCVYYVELYFNVQYYYPPDFCVVLLSIIKAESLIRLYGRNLYEGTTLEDVFSS